MSYLKCEWCDRNASTPVSLATGKLTGICLVHLEVVPTVKDAYGTRMTTAEWPPPNTAADRRLARLNRTNFDEYPLDQEKK